MNYVLYGPDPSGFTRKLEAALIFYDAPFERITGLGDERESLQRRAGTHQLPLLRTPENWILGDTTPIMQLLDGRFPLRRLFPAGPAGFFVHLIEELFDEWVSRVYVHYRWHYPENTAYALERLAGEIVSDPDAMVDWGRRSCRATGTEPATQRELAEREYDSIMAAADAQLARTPYLLGDRPSAVDAALLGGLRAHTDHDPLPDLSAYPNIVAFAQGARDGWDGTGELAGFPVMTGFAELMLNIARDCYGPFVEANRCARETGEKAFEIPVYGETVSFMAREYPEASRQMLAAHFRDRLSSVERTAVRQRLQSMSLDGILR